MCGGGESLLKEKIICILATVRQVGVLVGVKLVRQLPRDTLLYFSFLS